MGNRILRCDMPGASLGITFNGFYIDILGHLSSDISEKPLAVHWFPLHSRDIKISWISLNPFLRDPCAYAYSASKAITLKCDALPETSIDRPYR